MNPGKTLFAQLMDFLPWSTFARLVARYDGDRGVRVLSCAEQYRVMAFAQLIPPRRITDSRLLPNHLVFDSLVPLKLLRDDHRWASRSRSVGGSILPRACEPWPGRRLMARLCDVFWRSR